VIADTSRSRRSAFLLSSLIVFIVIAISKNFHLERINCYQ
jgi:uncharacterized membrane protein YhaH (DUF805 family)